ncbi:MAG: flagellar M-ring protein FliF [Treponema sp.]|nr:flagellar M-ring protein FliF [Treponema sp.]
MNEWFKRLGESIKNLWTKGTVIQKIILFAIVAVVIVAIILTASLSSRSTTVRLFNSPVADEMARTRILDKLSEYNIVAYTTDDGYISVEDERTARRMRDVLISEGLVPSNIDPFAAFYNRSWSTTDAEQNVRLKNAITQTVKQHIEAIDDITSADVNIVLPENTLFISEQNPVTASIILRVKPASSLLQDARRIRGIQSLVQMAVEGLRPENITITDADGNVLNDFAAMGEIDRVNLVARQQREIQKLEAYYRAQILKSLQSWFTEDRMRDLNIKIDMDMSKRTSDSTIYTPIVIRSDNPRTPYDDSEMRESLTISSQTVTKEWQGTGFNPEGPAGTEGQTPPVYSDMSNVIGRSTETGVTENRVVNTTQEQRETSPQIDRVTVAANVDGTWTTQRDPKTHQPVIDAETGAISRVYTPVPTETLVQVANYIQDAVGYDESKNYSVTVTNIQYDRSAQFAAEDEAYFARIRRRLAILISLGSIAAILLLFIVVRLIMRELERRRRLRDEELLRQQQAAREQALWDAKEEGVGVTMSVEESRRAELQENAIAMAKEHPEDVAMLIRTWLMEE